jgi:hypothetical protein
MIDLWQGIKKALFFAICAAVGCLLAAGVGEILLAYTLPPPVSNQVDVMFVLDVTGSMQEEISGVERGIASFVSQLSSQDLDAQVGLMSFGDRLIGEEPRILSFNGKAFTSDTNSFSQQVSQIEMMYGGDDEESSLDALVLAARQPFREKATKVILLITDAPPKIPDRDTDSIAAAAQAIRARGIDQLHLVIQDSDRLAFSGLQSRPEERIFSLAETAQGRRGFDLILPEMGRQIAAIATRKFAPEQFQQLLIATSLWTGILAIGIFMALSIGQNTYLRRPVLPVGKAIASTIGSLAAGLAAGAVGQLPFSGNLGSSMDWQLAGRIVAWTLLGALLGWGMGFFVPNLNPRRASVGGGIGGAVGAAGFLYASGSLGDIAGRLLGAAILGFFIGLTIAFVEVAFRQAWLEIHYGSQESRTVNLGAEPVSIGGDPHRCTIYARNAHPVALRFRLNQGQILCEDIPAGITRQLQPGEQQQVGNLAVIVRAAGTPARLTERHSTHQEISPPTQFQAQFSLYIKRRAIPLTNGTQLRANDISGLESQRADGVVAQVNPSPNDPRILGLQNCSHRVWVATLASGEQKQVASGRSIKLAVGTKINFGSVEGEIR